MVYRRPRRGEVARDPWHAAAAAALRSAGEDPER
jgi:hypothetical protein